MNGGGQPSEEETRTNYWWRSSNDINKYNKGVCIWNSGRKQQMR